MHGLKELSPGDPRFRRVLSYRTYRLRNTDGGRGPSVAYNTGVNTRRVAHVMASHIFDGSDSIAVLSFLSRFKQQMDNNKLSEGAACLICPNFLGGDAKEVYENNFELPEEEGGFNSWPEAVQFLLKSYAKDRHIEEALASLDDIKQMSEEKETAYAKRLRTQARRCGGVFTEPEMITRFIRGLHEDLKPLLRLTRADYSLPNVFQDFVERATAQGEAHRALAGREGKPPKRREGASAPFKRGDKAIPLATLRRGPQVYSVDPLEEHGDDLPYYGPVTGPPGGAPVMATQAAEDHLSDVPTAELDISDPTLSGAGSLPHEEAYLVQPNRNPRVPSYAQPTPQQRPGWLAFRNEPTDICFECFALGHKKPNCPYLAKTFYDANFREAVRRNYHKLTRQQKEYLRAIGRTPAFALAPPTAALPPPTPPGSQASLTASEKTGPRPGSQRAQPANIANHGAPAVKQHLQSKN